MSFPFRTILLPVDFDQTATAALDLARQFAAEGHVTLHLVHAMAILLATGRASSVVIARENDVRRKLDKIAQEHLGGTNYQVHTRMGDTASAIVEVAHDLNADLIVMPTHGRHGLPRLLLGSVAECVVRDAPCPVLTVRPSTVPEARETSVGNLMIRNPPSVRPADLLAYAHVLMLREDLLSIPVVGDGIVIGIITDRDIRSHLDSLENTLVKDAMAPGAATLAPTMPVEEAARLLVKFAVGALPVVDGGKLVGLLSSKEIIGTLLDRRGLDPSAFSKLDRGEK
jgi:nucleotide-binding universal stress UspA family protein/CBS domain-containing protein